MIFKRISRPYLHHYGPPDKEFKYNYEFKHYVDWLWWIQGMIVTFACPEDKEPGWWKVEEAHYFDPNIKNEIAEIEDKERLISLVMRNYAAFMLGSYLNKRKKYTLDWIKRKLWISGVEGEDLKYVFEQLIGYGEPKKYSEIFRECEKVKFKSKLLCPE